MFHGEVSGGVIVVAVGDGVVGLHVGAEGVDANGGLAEREVRHLFVIEDDVGEIARALGRGRSGNELVNSKKPYADARLKLEHYAALVGPAVGALAEEVEMPGAAEPAATIGTLIIDSAAVGEVIAAGIERFPELGDAD